MKYIFKPNIINTIVKINLNKFEFETDGIGFFPSEKYIRVVWVGLKSGECEKLKKLVEEKLHEIGINKDGREFNCHVTVARIKKVKDKKNFLQRIKELHIKKMRFDADKFSLIKSELTPRGPMYKILEEFELK